MLSRFCIGSLVSLKLGIETTCSFLERLKGRICGGQAWEERGGENKTNGASNCTAMRLLFYWLAVVGARPRLVCPLQMNPLKLDA